jgi:hypothetical protein
MMSDFVLSIIILCSAALIDVSVIVFIILKRRTLKSGWTITLTVIAFLLTLALAAVIALSLAMGSSNHPIASPQPYLVSFAVRW